jgi:hypothetical protein
MPSRFGLTELRVDGADIQLMADRDGDDAIR